MLVICAILMQVNLLTTIGQDSVVQRTRIIDKCIKHVFSEGKFHILYTIKVYRYMTVNLLCFRKFLKKLQMLTLERRVLHSI